MLLALAISMFAVAAAAALLGLRQLFVEVPPQDRRFLDAPPPAFRYVWPLVQLIAYRSGRLLPLTYRDRTEASLRHAGCDFRLSPEQFFAGKVLTAVLAVALLEIVTWPRASTGLHWFVAVALLGFVVPDVWLRDQRESRRRQILKALPFHLDLVTLCVESGLNLTSALANTVARAPANPLRDELGRVQRDLRTGKSRAEALRALAERMRMPEISSVVAALATADRQGAALGPILRAQAEQRRNERFQRAEKLAMQAPVKMLMPLIGCIFPCTFAVIAFPIVLNFVEQGFFR